jgi:hypothetical protein
VKKQKKRSERSEKKTKGKHKKNTTEVKKIVGRYFVSLHKLFVASAPFCNFVSAQRLKAVNCHQERFSSVAKCINAEHVH